MDQVSEMVAATDAVMVVGVDVTRDRITVGFGPVIVYGPQGCGKTRHSEALAAHFGVCKVVDDWMPGDPVEPGALHLSQVEVPGAVAYESLKAVLNLCDTCRGAREIRRPYSAVERMPCPICTSAQS